MHHPDKLQEIVRVAKELENKGQIKESKHKFLDAADYAIQLSKVDDNIKRLAYQNIAKELIKYAKDLQMEILLQQDQLPLPPGVIGSKSALKSQKGILKTPARKPTQLFQLLIIREGGIPVYSYSFSEISNSTKLRLNEILFSGAITAINQIMIEVLEKSIQTIKFEDGVLLIQPAGNLYMILYANSEDDEVLSRMKAYCKSIIDKFSAKIEGSVMSGQTLNDDPDLIAHMKLFFHP